MRLVLMRHGETDWNNVKRIQGRKDIAINHKGVNQVKETCLRFLKNRQYNFSIIVTSPLMRTKQSALICSEILNLTILELSYFRERSFGILEGKTAREIEKQYKISDVENIDGSIFNLEDISALTKRVNQGLDFLKSNYQTEEVLLVTHGSIIKLIGKSRGLNIGIIDNGGYIEIEKLRCSGLSGRTKGSH